MYCTLNTNLTSINPTRSLTIPEINIVQSSGAALAKDGKLEVRQITPTRLAIKYTVNGAEYSETINNK
ncbi:MAG: hypothetical protein IJP54_03310 [Synergistaceae bacterium]|nr:hypothetical protein [Synergistaceae bacterium]